MKIKKTLLSLGLSCALSTCAMSAHAQNAYGKPAEEHGYEQGKANIKHVLLISVDGLHQNDLDWFVKNNPASTLASLVNKGVAYNNARTPFPSDSFPGLVAQTTGGNPASTGIYYDDSYSRALLPNGTTQPACQAGMKPGAEVYYAEVVEQSTAAGDFLLDAFQGIAGVYPVPDFTPGDLNNAPTSILKLVGAPDDVRSLLMDPANLPVDPTNCTVVYPHQYLQVNTIFEVAHAKGLRTAWTDKHPAYEILNGPSGYGVDDLFAPEINSLVDNTLAGGNDWTKDNVNTQQYDTFHVLSIINEINGHDHSGKSNPGTPAIFGMNFQTVSTAQKLNTSTTTTSHGASLLGGYVNNGSSQVPGPVLQGALSFVDSSLKQIVDSINNNPATQGKTAIIVSAKHGQSPQNRADLTIIDDGALQDNLNAAWAFQYPNATQPLIAHAMDDDGVLIWLNDRSTTALTFTKTFLENYTTGKVINVAGSPGSVSVPAGIGSDADGNKISNKNFTSAGLSQIFAGNDAQKFIGVNSTDKRVPDVIGIATQGSVYAGGKLSKIAEHGGNSVQDRHVPIVAWAPGIKAQTISTAVETKQIAPTILHLLGIDPNELQAVQIEKTKVLPGLN